MATETQMSIAAKAAALLMHHPWKVWFWGDSIGIEGLMAASDLTGDEQYRAFALGLVQGWISRQKDPRPFEYTAPGVGLLQLYEHYQHPVLLAAARQHAEYLARFRRTDQGAFVRYEDAAIELPPELPADHPDHKLTSDKLKHVKDGGPCVFVDNMHFDGPFFAKLYAVTREERYRQLAVDNVLSSTELLLNRPARLFNHFWIEQSRQSNGVLWGRGNGWAMLGLLETLEHLPATEPSYCVMLKIFREQAEALVSLQDTSGDWHTILNDKGSYLETSIAAFVVTGFGLAIRKGWLSGEYRSVVDRAMNAMLSHVQPDGRLAGVSYETFPSTNPEHYRQMPRDAVVPWGQGPLLTALQSYRLLCESQK